MTPSEVLTPSIISERRGTKIIEQEHPKRASPPAESVISLKLRFYYYTYLGNLKIYDGPNISNATKAIRNAENVNHFLEINVVKQPTNGDEMAYVAHINPKK